MSDWIKQHRQLSLGAVALASLVLIGLVWVCWQYQAGDGGFAFRRPPASPTQTATASPTPVPTSTPSPIATKTPSPTSTLTHTPTSTSTVTATATPTQTLTATATATEAGGHILPVPVILQELPLSCEFAGMRMFSAALLGQAPDEKALIDCMPRDPNPYLGFRGNPAGSSRHEDGTINWDNYGVYAPAVAETLNQCVLQPSGSRFRAVAIKGVSYEEVMQSLQDGYPVIVWVTKRQQAETTVVDTSQGPVQLAFGEHVWVVVGYYEDGTFAVHDPYPQKDGRQTLRVRNFPNWDLFDQMAVFAQFGEANQ